MSDAEYCDQGPYWPELWDCILVRFIPSDPLTFGCTYEIVCECDGVDGGVSFGS